MDTVHLRRMVSTPLLLASLLLAILVAAVVTAALASFGARALPAAVHQRLAVARQTAIAVTGQIGAARVAANTKVIGSAVVSCTLQKRRAAVKEEGRRSLVNAAVSR